MAFSGVLSHKMPLRSSKTFRPLLLSAFQLSSVSVWFRSKERPRKGILGFGRARNETRAKSFLSSPPPPCSFTYAIFRAVFDTRSSFFAPKPHGKRLLRRLLLFVAKYFFRIHRLLTTCCTLRDLSRMLYFAVLTLARLACVAGGFRREREKRFRAHAGYCALLNAIIKCQYCRHRVT